MPLSQVEFRESLVIITGHQKHPFGMSKELRVFLLCYDSVDVVGATEDIVGATEDEVCRCLYVQARGILYRIVMDNPWPVLREFRDRLEAWHLPADAMAETILRGYKCAAPPKEREE